jgi:hypothetical protein
MIIDLVVLLAPDIYRIVSQAKSERERNLQLEALLKRRMQEELHDRTVRR